MKELGSQKFCVLPLGIINSRTSIGCKSAIITTKDNSIFFIIILLGYLKQQPFLVWFYQYIYIYSSW